jgi:hypothetical protein
MARSPKSVRRLLQDKPTLKFLDREIAAQGALLTQIRQCLPPELAAHCVNAQLHESRLTLHTDSPVWATRLRYLAAQLISVLKHGHPGLREIKVKLLVERHSPPQHREPAHRSEVAAALVRDSADDTEQAPLREALLRLSNSIKPR